MKKEQQEQPLTLEQLKQVRPEQPILVRMRCINEESGQPDPDDEEFLIWDGWCFANADIYDTLEDYGTKFLVYHAEPYKNSQLKAGATNKVYHAEPYKNSQPKSEQQEQPLTLEQLKQIRPEQPILVRMRCINEESGQPDPDDEEFLIWDGRCFTNEGTYDTLENYGTKFLVYYAGP